jgi:hypothetical protein
MTLNKASYSRFIVVCYLIGGGLKIVKSAYKTILPINRVPTIKDNAHTMEGWRMLQEAYNI